MMLQTKILKNLAAGIFTLSLILNSSTPQAEAEKKIVINSASRILSLYENDKKIAIYPLGLGKVSTPTPTGYYKIRTKEKNPPWIDPAHPEYEVPSGPNNPLGYRWMQIQGNYGIHGTNRPSSIGHYVSNGCVRMLEKNVEELFDKVSIGTPVEITYNRVVVEKIDDGNVVYYIYPDGYRWQNLNVKSVSKWLDAYGVSPFESDENIAKKIKNSDGQPTFLGKPYDVEIDGAVVPETEQNGRKFFAKAVVKDEISYLPAVPIAISLKTKLEWHPETSTLKTNLGEVKGYNFKKQLYINSADATTLFGVNGGFQSEKGIFKFSTNSAPLPAITETVEPEKVAENLPTQETPQTENNSATIETENNSATTQVENNSAVTETAKKITNKEPEGEVIETVVIEEVVG